MLVAVAVAIAVMLALSGRSWAHTRSQSALLLLLGSACFVVVVMAHVAEGLRWFPSMGWGLPHSAGHYVDLVSALVGLTLVVTGLVVWGARYR